MLKKGFFILIISIFINYSQANQYSFQLELINKYFKEIEKTESIEERLLLNDSIITALSDILADTLSFSLPFDSVGLIGIIKSPDKLFNIFNWHIKLAADIYQYYGIIQYYKQDENIYKLFYLRDNSDNISDFENIILTDTSWYGVLYYDLILKEFNGEKIYTLFGFDYYSTASRRKVIEILYFEDDSVKFGKPVFYSVKNIANHIIFEYSSNAVMTLRYDKDNDMIVFDHLSPMKPTLEGHYEFYGPDLSYDGFKFENGYWKYISSIDIRNPKQDKIKN